MSNVGVVKSFFAQKGYGFVELGGKDIFLVKSELHGLCPEAGCRLEFDVISNDRKPEKGEQATNIKILEWPGEPFYYGEVKLFREQGGYGFINCEQFPGEDIFLLKSQCPGMQAPYNGAKCKFAVTQENKGPVAQQVQLLGTTSPQAQLPQQSVYMQPMMQKIGTMGGKGLGVYRAPMKSFGGAFNAPMLGGGGNGLEGQHMHGTVKLWFADKNYGFIRASSCPTDIYFSSEDGRQWEVGQAVSFIGKVMPDGVMRARNVQEGIEQGMNMGGTVRSEGRRTHGTVKSFFAAKGFGFIRSPSCPSDIYFSDEVGSQWAPGQSVSFFTHVMPDGVVRAREVQEGHAQGGLEQGMLQNLHIPAVKAEGKRMHGKVKSFFAGKGYGFISATGCPTDVYFNDPPIGGSQWSPGQAVSFIAQQMPDGVMRAREVQGGLEEGMQLVGTVKKWHSGKGYGFLEVPDGVGDIYFKKDDVPPELLETSLQGMTVKFTVGIQPDGKPMVREAEFLQTSPKGYRAPSLQQKRPAPGGGQQHGFGQPPAKRQFTGRGNGMGMGRENQGYGNQGWGGGGQQLTGTVKSYNANKGFGFIISRQVAGDIYFKGQYPEITGRLVKFALTESPDGKPQAQNMRMM
eukprot:gnl/MRDRNA2_/MRDRNA2_76274_c0_seq2.p1 gnl/MRDRNA2_/MRDRNA2_76274_c0~~gnl/MRDRNA2_/MRDRNA2_76274_c0_seq2.p1  ORF type:complete len:627 (+),score=131.48 gnl/MRDRNA2_/MRDRNA2_76274_c0_seq2:83-1963(+)